MSHRLYDEAIAITADDGLVARQLELDGDTDGLIPVVPEQPDPTWGRVELGHGSSFHCICHRLAAIQCRPPTATPHARYTTGQAPPSMLIAVPVVNPA